MNAEVGTSLRMARQAAGLSLAQMAAEIHFDRGFLSRVERNERSASPVVVAAYERVLARVDRRDFIAGAMAMAVPVRIGPGDIKNLQRRVLYVERWDRETGGGTTAHLALSELQYATRLRSSSGSPAARNAVAATVANLADVAGWACFDAGDLETARKAFGEGRRAANESGDAGMAAHVASGLARLEIEARRPVEALAIAEEVSSGTSGLTASMLAVVRAQAHAAQGDRAKCLAALSEADRLHPGDISNAPSWLEYFTAAKLAADTGLALWRLRDSGCIPTLETSAQTLPSSRARAKAMAAAQLATALYRQRRPEEGWFWLTKARSMSGQVRSTRLINTLNQAERGAKEFGMTEVLAEGRVWQAGAMWIAEIGAPPNVNVIGTRDFGTKEEAEAALRTELARKFPGVEPTINVYDE